MIIFELKTEWIELHKLLKITGLTDTGGEAKQAIANGFVTVDRNIEKRKANKIRAGQKIAFNGSLIEVRAGSGLHPRPLDH